MKVSLRIMTVTLAALLCMPTMTAWADNYDDFNDITSHINLSTTQKLSFTRPGDDITITSSSYFLAGTSSPYSDLTLNGEVLDNRGSNGAWGKFVALEAGENTFTIQQDGAYEQITITRQSSTTAATTKVISSLFPTTDVAYLEGETITLTCVAPSGSNVTARVGSRTIQMEQKVATSQNNVPATYTGKVTAGSVDGTESIGKVTYTLNNNTTYTSVGQVYIGSGRLMVEVTDPSATIFDRAGTDGNFLATAKQGAVDVVTETNDEMYHLRMGGWILKRSTQPLQQNPIYLHSPSDIYMNQANKGERFVLEGVGSPLAAAAQTATGLQIQLYNTSYSGSIPVGQSSLFNSAYATQEGNDLVLTFDLAGGQELWGYLVEYVDGNTIIYCKYKPQLHSGSRPLEGMTIMLDPGHGAIDSGAIGVTGTQYAMEKHINLDTALAVQKRLVGLGANVEMIRVDDSINPTLNQRLQMTQDVDADLFIALHCNSSGYAVDANKPNGTEVYYYEEISKTLATALASNVSSQTGRNNRGARYSNFKVTLNSYAPSVLVELGFLTNPSEYDNLCNKRNIYRTANAVADSIQQALQ